MNWFEASRLAPGEAELLEALRRERIVWDLSDPAQADVLRRDVERIAADMDSPRKSPPMFWSGIPLPPPGREPSCDYHFILSVGGTKTDFALLRMDRGEVVGLDLQTGREVRDPAEIDRVKTETQMETPAHGQEVSTGKEMIARIVGHIAPHVRRQQEAFERCESVLLSWGFPHRVVRTGERLAGGLSAVITEMTKAQAPLTESLRGEEVGKLFCAEMQRQIGWSRPVAVANDTVMALHYFLGPGRADHARVGLFINGTGTNYSAAEPYAVRSEGFISKPGEQYVPDRITRSRPLAPGEQEMPFFVNYEAGSIDLEGTRTRFDTDPEYPLERNVLAGGNAFRQQMESFTTEFVSPAAYEILRRNWAEETDNPDARPDGRAVSRMADDGDCPLLKGLDASRGEPEKLRLIARAVAARSALHAALVLAAITRRTGFGTGSRGAPDVLGLEGSVWKTPAYKDLVKEAWGVLSAPAKLSVDFASESAYNASLSGPLYLAALHGS